MWGVAREIKRLAGSKLVRHAINDKPHLAFENVIDLFLRMRMRGHATPSLQGGEHLIHRLAMGYRPARDAGTNFNRRIFWFHLRILGAEPWSRHNSTFFRFSHLSLASLD